MVVYIYFPALGSCQTACTAYCHPYYVLLPSGVSVASEVRPTIVVYLRLCNVRMYIYLYLYLYLFVCLFVCGKHQTTERIDAKCPLIAKNDLESVLRGLKLPVSVLSGRYRDISGFSFAPDRHFYLSTFHFRLLP